MTKGLVSIITPCFNTGNCISRLLDSVLMQDYPSVEMFAINDGSTDNTEEIIKSYIPKFESKGYSLSYVYQKNSGQSVALNNGLKMLNGEYMLWPDSDDYYVDDKIVSKLVSKMQSGDYAIGRCRARVVNEEGIVAFTTEISPLLCQEDQFENYLFGANGMLYAPVAYIANIKILDEVLPHREIYTEKMAGQNAQIIVPMSYKQKCFYINDVGAEVLERSNSHSRGLFKGYEQEIEKDRLYERTRLGSLNEIKDIDYNDRNKYTKEIHNRHNHGKMMLSIFYGRSKEALYYYSLQLEAGRKPKRITSIACRFCDSKVLFLLIRIYLKLTGLTI